MDIKSLIKSKKFIYISALVFIVLFSVAYSALSQTLGIFGNTRYNVRYPIRVTNIVLQGTQNSGTEQFSPSYTWNTTTTGVNLPNLNSTVTYTVTVRNYGDTDKGISLNITSNSNSDMTYQISNMPSNNMVLANSVVTFNIIVKYDPSVQSLPGSITDTMTITYSFGLAGAMFITGPEVNGKMKQFVDSSYTYTSSETTITDIVRFTGTPNPSNIIDSNIVSTNDSLFPIYMWYDSANTIIYWYSESANVYYNQNAKNFYSNLRALNNISCLSEIKTNYSTDMSSMFMDAGYNSTSFTLQFGQNFDTSNVNRMAYMFYETGYNDEAFTLDLGPNFDTSNVTDMSRMFYYTACKSPIFTLNLGEKFDTSNVTDMSYMFYNLGNTNPLFDELDLGSKFDTGKVKYMQYMFCSCKNISRIYATNLFVTTSVTNSNSMFSGCLNLMGMLGTKLTSSYLDSTYARIDGGTSNPGYFSTKDSFQGAMFKSGRAINGRIKKYSNPSSTIDSSDSVVTKFTRFLGTPNSNYLIDANKVSTTTSEYPIYMWFDTENTTIYWYSSSNYVYYNYNSSYFYHRLLKTVLSSTNHDIKSDYVYNMLNMFSYLSYNDTSIIELDLGPYFDTSNVKYMDNMFDNCRFMTIYAPTTFVTNSVISSTDMFKYCSSLVGGAGTVFNSSYKDASYAHIDEGSNNPGYFTSRTPINGAMFKPGKLINVKMKKYNNSSATYSTTDTTITNIQRYTSTPNSSYLVDENIVSTLNSQSPIYMWYSSGTVYWYSTASNIYFNPNSSYFFSNLRAINSIANLNAISLTYVSDLSYMFNYTGYSSSSFILDLGTNFNTATVTDMQYMFNYVGYNNTSFTLNLRSNFDTSNVTNMSNMFSNAGYKSTSFTFNLGSKFDTSKVTKMQSMFSYAGYSSTVITLSLGSLFDTSNVDNMSYMFAYVGYNNTSFTFNLGDKFDTSKVTSMSWMFARMGFNSTRLTLDLGSKFDTSLVEGMGDMFAECGFRSTVMTLNLGSKFDTSNVTFMREMFYGCGSDSTVFTLDLGSKFDTSKVTDMYRMFLSVGSKNTSFTLDLGDKFDTSNVNTMTEMFAWTGNQSTSFTLNLGNKFDTSNVIYMGNMFQYMAIRTPNLVIDLGPKFNTSNVTKMDNMFKGITRLKTIIVPSSFVTTSVTSSADMFTGCTNLVGGAGTVYDSSNVTATYAHIDGGTSNPGYFTALHYSFRLNGAYNETITYTGTKSGTFTTNGDSYVNASLPAGTYTFTSSVAKSTTSSSQAYSQSVTITPDTTVVNFYPPGAVLWYGNGRTTNSSLYSVAGGVSWKKNVGPNATCDTGGNCSSLGTNINGDPTQGAIDNAWMTLGSASEPGYVATIFVNNGISMTGYSVMKFSAYYSQGYNSPTGPSCYDSSDGTTGAVGRVYAANSKNNGFSASYGATLSRATTSIYTTSPTGTVYPGIMLFTAYCSNQSYGSYSRIDGIVRLYAVWRE